MGPGQPTRAHTAATDSLRSVLNRTPPDSSRGRLLLKLACTYRAARPGSTLYLAQRAPALARRLGFGRGRGWACRYPTISGGGLKEDENQNLVN